MTRIKQPGTAGYVSISGGRIAAILLVSICSFALAWATRSGDGNKSNTSAESPQPLPAHTKQPAMNRAACVACRIIKATKAAKRMRSTTHTQHKQGAKRNQGAQGAASRAQHSVGAGHSGKPKSDATPTPEENPSPTPATTLGLSQWRRLRRRHKSVVRANISRRSRHDCICRLCNPPFLVTVAGYMTNCWEIIADNLSKAGWSWRCVSAIDSNSGTIWIADAHRDNGKRFVAHAGN